LDWTTADSTSSCSSQESRAAIQKRSNSIILLTCHHYLIHWKRAPPKPKSKKVIRERRHPNHVIQALIKDKLFLREFQMRRESFNKLYSFVFSDLKAKAKCAQSDAVHPKQNYLLPCFLRYSAGGSYLDLIQIHEIGRTKCYITCIQKLISTILKNHELGQWVWPVLDFNVQTYAPSGKRLVVYPTNNVVFYKVVWVQLMGY
jgi:hypothetical protein